MVPSTSRPWAIPGAASAEATTAPDPIAVYRSSSRRVSVMRASLRRWGRCHPVLHHSTTGHTCRIDEGDRFVRIRVRWSVPRELRKERRHQGDVLDGPHRGAHTQSVFLEQITQAFSVDQVDRRSSVPVRLRPGVVGELTG